MGCQPLPSCQKADFNALVTCSYNKIMFEQELPCLQLAGIMPHHLAVVQQHRLIFCTAFSLLLGTPVLASFSSACIVLLAAWGQQGQQTCSGWAPLPDNLLLPI